MKIAAVISANILTEELNRFIEELRLAGYNIGTEQFLAAQRLIVNLAAQDKLPSRLSQLKILLGPALCCSPKEQEEFGRHFDNWARQVESVESPEPQPEPREIESELRRIEKGAKIWKWAFIIVAAVMIAGFAGFYLQDIFSEPPVPVEPIPTKPAPTPMPVSKQGKIETEQNESQFNLLWGILLLPLLLWLLWSFWQRYQTRRFLARKTVSTEPDIIHLLTKGMDIQLIQSASFLQIAHKLRKHLDIPADTPDIDATLKKTLQAAGWLMLVMGTRKIAPEYLVLLDRTTLKDHQTQRISVFLDKLEKEGVFVTRYYFDTEPLLCYSAQEDFTSCSLTELSERYPDHCLMIFSDGIDFTDAVTGEAAQWLERLAVWPQRILFTPELSEQWEYRKQALENADLPVAPFDETGLAAFAEQTSADTHQQYAKSMAPRLPEILTALPHRWLERHTPKPAVLAVLLKQTQDFLGEEAYYWLGACAVYPELHWPLTLYLGYQLTSKDGKRLLTEDRLARLASLPWFRYGYIPDWLRKRLMLDLSLAQEREIRSILQALLAASLNKNIQNFPLEIAHAQKSILSAFIRRLLPELVQRAAKDSYLREHIFLTFIKGRLSVNIPKIRHTLFVNSKKNISFLQSLYIRARNRILNSLWPFIKMMTSIASAGLVVFLLAAIIISIIGGWNNLEQSLPSSSKKRPGDIKKLVSSNECPKCSLEGLDLQTDLGNKSLQNVKLGGANLKNANLKRADLRKAQLQNANLRSAKLGGAKLNGAKLTGARLKHATLDRAFLEENADLENADLQFASLKNAHLKGANLKGADLQKAKLNGAKLKGAKFGGADLRKADFTGASLQQAEFKGVLLQHAIFKSAYLQNVDFEGAYLDYASFEGANLNDIKLEGAYIRGINLKKATAKGMNFQGTSLRSVNLEAAILPEAIFTGMDLQEQNLSGADLSGANFSEADLRRADLSGATLTGADFKKADLESVNLQNATLKKVEFQGANLQKVNFYKAKLQGAHLNKAKLQGANFQDADLTGADLEGANLAGAILNGADLTGAKLRRANLEGTNLTGFNLKKMDLSGANLKRANLMGADLSGAWLIDANFEAANLEGANLKEAILRNAHLEAANLEGANLNAADLENAHFERANLKETDMQRADLSNANLFMADLSAANLAGAALSGTDFTKATTKGLICKNSTIRGAIGLQDMVCP